MNAVPIILACAVTALCGIPIAAGIDHVPEALILPYCLFVVFGPGAIWLGVWYGVSRLLNIK